MTLFHERFAELAARMGDKIFLDDQRLATYDVKETLKVSEGFAFALQEAGLNPGDALIAKMGQNAQSVLLLYASQILGLILIPIDVRQEEKAIYGIDPRVKGVIFQKDPSSPHDFTLSLQGEEKDVSLPSLEEAKPFSSDREENLDAMWILTSGSEGGFKIVRHSQKTLFSHYSRFAKPACYYASDSEAILLPLYHVFGISTVLLPIVVGYSMHFPLAGDPESILKYLKEKKITHLSHVPSFHYALAKKAQEIGIHLTDLRAGATAGAPMEASRFSEIEDTLGMKLLPCYGSSEIITISALGEEGDRERRRTSVGPLLEGTELKILDENGNKLPIGEIGEITVKSPSLMLGYLGRKDGIDEDGFFATGDMGYLDERGDLHITGRKKLIIIRNGHNLSIVEIEKQLLSLKGVADCCVVGIKDPASGEAPGAIIVMEDGYELDEIWDAIHQNLAKNLWPKVIIFQDELPLLPSGKPDRVKAKNLLC